MQSELPGERRYARGTLAALRDIAASEGPRALYRGFAPKALRLGVGQTVGLLAFQRLQPLLGGGGP